MSNTSGVSTSGPIEGLAFYCVTDAAGFLGAVGLLNSLRLVGHEEPFLLLDCGLDDEQRELLAPHAVVVPSPPNLHPTLLKSMLPLARPADVMVLLDADVIVLRHLRELVALAASGNVVAFANDHDRHRPDWGQLLGLGALPRRRYVNAGHLLFPLELGTELLHELEGTLERVGLGRALVRGDVPRRGTPDDPLFYSDQDVLNALLAARVPDDRVTILDARLAPFPPFAGLTADPARFRCVQADGTEPFLLHHVLRKPWLAALRHSVYSQLLSRLLVGDDLAVRVPMKRVPLRLRSGRLAQLDRTRAHLQAVVLERVRGRLGLRPHLESLVGRSLPRP